MASKNITVSLFLAINLVFFGFTMAQAPGPQAPICPRTSTQVQDCVNVLNVGMLLNAQNVRPCCTLVSGLAPSVASACICDAVKITVLDILQITLNLNRVLGLCGVSPPAGFTCA